MTCQGLRCSRTSVEWVERAGDEEEEEEEEESDRYDLFM